MFTVVCCHCTDPFNFYPGTAPNIGEIKLWGAIYGAVPVSYTHIDVYKRQVGYTNVGKSTMMNLLSKSEVFAENKLFATLDTTCLLYTSISIV